MMLANSMSMMPECDEILLVGLVKEEHRWALRVTPQSVSINNEVDYEEIYSMGDFTPIRRLETAQRFTVTIDGYAVGEVVFYPKVDA